jgi:twitching motility two-component system response regulator PilH
MSLVLIVDDSPTEVHLLRQYLERHGYQTEAAEDGTEAVNKARELKPDLVLMDIVMPEIRTPPGSRC